MLLCRAELLAQPLDKRSSRAGAASGAGHRKILPKAVAVKRSANFDAPVSVRLASAELESKRDSAPGSETGAIIPANMRLAASMHRANEALAAAGACTVQPDTRVTEASGASAGEPPLLERPPEPQISCKLFADERLDMPAQQSWQKEEDGCSVITEAMLPSAPADIDLDSELEEPKPQAQSSNHDAASPSISATAAEAASAAAERARRAARRGMAALSVTWAMCMQQARQAASACRLDCVESCMRSLPSVAARLVPPSPARKGLQTLVSESASLWAGALWKILMLQVLVIIKTVVSQGNVIARSFMQAASLEPMSLVPDSPLLQRQRIRAKALAAAAKAEEARARMQELKAQMADTIETLRSAELASQAHTSQQQGKCSTWSESDFLQAVASSGSGWWGASQQQQQQQHHAKEVSFKGSSGALSPAASRVPGARNAHRTPRTHLRECHAQALLMSASRHTPLPASPLPPPTPAPFM